MSNDPELINIDACQILSEMDLLCPEKISEKELKNCFLKLKNQLTQQELYSPERINQILQNQEPVIFTFKIFPQEYIYWISVKLSITDKKYIQQLLSLQYRENNNKQFLNEITSVVLPSLEHYFKWTPNSVIDEVQNWIEVTTPLSEESIFVPSVQQMIFLHLRSFLVDKSESEKLRHLIYSNVNEKWNKNTRGTKEGKFLICIPSIQQLVDTFNVLRRRQKTPTSSIPDLALWISKNFHGITPQNMEIKFKQTTIIRYLESIPPSPHEAELW